ncbi:hypothetical protein SUGI_0453710 [Cryptomeria japonica]|uniref:clavaminate synthase-like protein At3g21360 n=1 Tax=Cryptomeria japonica TaxID=3369 RepID=UPI0024089557|nr:clavaminate synthase-like protein At3g21360 [Cryptomeria japonica]GLJ23878.1 hypothetical protein SUGI_0453710 [Cryptomeria japonica]
MGSLDGFNGGVGDFVEGRLAEQKVVDGKLFPKVFLPANDVEREDVQALVQKIRSNKAWLEDEVVKSNTLLFRGFPVRSAEDFKVVVEAFGWEEQQYLGFSPRTKIVDRVFTANEAPLHHQIDFHHEMSMMKDWPSKLFFFCETAPPEGGESAIAPSHLIPPLMEKTVPEFVKKAREFGLLFKITTPSQDVPNSLISKSWKTMLNTSDPEEAKKRAADILGCMHFECHDDGTAGFKLGPLEIIRMLEKEKGKEVWFTTIAGYGQGSKNQLLMLGDESTIPIEVVEAFKSIMDEQCVNLKLKDGDVLLLNNLAVQHGRRPSKPPRKVLVSVCK